MNIGHSMPLAWSQRRPHWAALVGLVLAAVSCPAMGQPEIAGRWVEPAPVDGDYSFGGDQVAHAIHLPTQRVLVWKFNASARLWDPTTGDFTNVPANNLIDIFCSGHAGLADGSVLVAGGGDEGPNTGINEAKIFSLGGAFGGPWVQKQDMNFARWYPTCTTLFDGTVLATSGKDGMADLVDVPEIYFPLTDQWATLPNADQVLPIYPFMFVLPWGNNVFFAGGVGKVGSTTDTFVLDVQSGLWSNPIPSPFAGVRGSAVMYEPGKVLKSGGQLQPGNCESITVIDETAIIDLSDPNNPDPQWQDLIFAEMVHARRHHNLVMLPDGKILAVGGENNCDCVDGVAAGCDCECDDVLAAEWFDPNEPLPLWRPLAEMTFPRRHHSFAVLLPDATVLVAGQPGPVTAEIFEPPYLFVPGGAATRPEIGFAPTKVEYGQDFTVVMTALSVQPIERVTLVRLGAVTHNFDQNQRYVRLEFDVVDVATLEVQAPAHPNQAPPGYYMLFLVSVDGVPSVAKYVQLVSPTQ